MESVNAANVQAKNAPEETDDAEVYVNTAVLSIDKNVRNPYLELGDGREANEFRVGEQVEYEVIVNNLQKGSIARDLVVSDVSLPQGLALDPDEGALVVSGIPQTILNPVGGTDDLGNQLDPENYNEVVEKAVEYQLVREGTGWVLRVSDLPYQTPHNHRIPMYSHPGTERLGDHQYRKGFCLKWCRGTGYFEDLDKYTSTESGKDS